MNRNTLLVVDDVEVNRAILSALFENNYNILEAENGEQALLLLNQYKDLHRRPAAGYYHAGEKRL